MSDFLKQIRDDHHQFDFENISDQFGNEPFEVFNLWLKEAVEAKCIEPNAMQIASVGMDGFPQSRVVYLKELINNQLVFYTNFSSEKGKAILNNPKVSAHFFWGELARQIHVYGLASKVSNEVSDAYFESRPRGSQLGAWASFQSERLENRVDLERRIEQLDKQYPDKIPRPDNWGGFQINVQKVEFWQGRPSRLHDRICFDLQSTSKWEIYRKNP